MITLEQIVKSEQDALIAESRIGQCPPYVVVNDLEIVRTTPRGLRDHHPVTIRPLETSSSRSFIVECSSLPSRVLWVASSNEAYREDYLTFLNATYNLGLSALPKSHDVDHLYNRSRAQAYGMRFIRTALVGYSVNRSHGAGYEKDITTNEAMRFCKDRKLMDEITSMKYFGFLSPLRSNPREAEVNSYANFAASKLGLNYEQVKESVLYLRQKASTPWARKP